MRRPALVAAGVAISAGCLWLALRGVSLGDVRSSLEGAHWVWLVPTLALTYATLAVRAVRWRFLFEDPGAVPTWDAAKALNIGLMFNSILPSRAGEVPRTFALGKSTGVPKVEIAATIVVERILDLLSVAVVGVLAWPLLPRTPWINALCGICAIIVVAVAIFGTVACLLRRHAVALTTRLLHRLPFVEATRVDVFVASLARGARVVRHPKRLLLALAFSLLVWVVTAMSILALYPAFDLSVTSASAWLILVATSLAMTVPSTAGGIGVYEAAVQASLVAFGVASSTALSYALVLHAVNLFPLVLTGAIASWGAVNTRHGGRTDSVLAPRG
jgi:uncharacterized protein (TIRG00374 family)